MSTQTQTKPYQLKGNPVVQFPVVGNLVYDELGKKVLAIHNERFRDVSGIEDTYNYQKDQPISFSNVPRILSYNQILRERFPDLHVLSPEEVVRYRDSIPERGSTYADTNSVSLYPNEGGNEDLRKRALDLVGKTKTNVPLVRV